MTEPHANDAWQRRFERERAARKQSESLLHEKSRELFEANVDLAARASELDRRARRERTLASIATDLAMTESRDDFFALLRARAAQFLEMQCLRTVERMPGGQLRLTTIHADDTAAPSPSDPPSTEVVDTEEGHLDADSALVYVLQTGRRLATPAHAIEQYSDWRFIREQIGVKHFAIVPLREAAGLLGAMVAGWTDDPRSDDDRIALLEQLAAVVGAHLSALRAREDLARSNEILEQTVARRTAELKASEERFAILFDYAPLPMLMVDGDRVIRQANRGASALFGYELPELVGRPVNDLVPVGSRARHDTHMRAFRAQHDRGGLQRMGGRGVTVLRGDGTTFVAELVLATVEIGGALFTLVGVTDVTEMDRAQAALRRSLNEKVTLLQEIHHRVKNNLQIISSLLFLQQDGLAEESARVALQESVFRVRSMALIHEALYGVASLDRIDLHEYAQRLCTSLQSSLAPRTRVQVAPGGIVLGVDTAVPIGLILNELVTNALKYGTPPPSRGTVEASVLVELVDGETHFEMRVRDNGPGLTRNPLDGGRVGLGLQLVRSLTRQIRGTLAVEPGEGTTFHLRWPRQELPEPAAP